MGPMMEARKTNRPESKVALRQKVACTAAEGQELRSSVNKLYRVIEILGEHTPSMTCSSSDSKAEL